MPFPDDLSPPFGPLTPVSPFPDPYDTQTIGMVPPLSPSRQSPRKRPHQDDDNQPKGQMYNKNTYVRFIISKLIDINPYFTTAEIQQVLKENQIEYKEATMLNILHTIRRKYLTPLKEIIDAFERMGRALPVGDRFIVNTINFNTINLKFNNS